MYLSVKRTLDVLFSTILIVLTLPLNLCIALIIFLDGNGPVFFRQTRIGRGGIPFTILKFRTMYLRVHNVENPLTAVTPFGRFLRRWGLDEMPQLWNVLTGTMSIVGPRPTLPEQVAIYSDHEKQRLQMRPGITGWAQIHGRNAIDWPARIELDIEYVQKASFFLDAWIVLKTPQALLKDEGTYGPGGLNKPFISMPQRPS